MSRSVCSLAIAAICASTVLASAQVTSSPTEKVSSSAPVAYIYVSTMQNSSTGKIYGGGAAANGSLSMLPGSPYPYVVNYLAVNGGWLFGVGNQDDDIYSFKIGSNGALTLEDDAVVTTMGGGAISIYLDHTGSTLYADYYTTNNDFLSYRVNQSTGALSFIGDLS